MSYITDKFDDKIFALLKQGGVGLLPTDTIYGLSASALNKDAVEKIHGLKGRSSSKPLIVLISDIKMLDLLSIPVSQAEIAKNYWPGPLSLEFKASDAPIWLHRGLGHFAIRMPAFAELRTLISQVGPLVSTSANLEGGMPSKSVGDAQAIFKDKLDFYVDVGELDNPPSTLAVVKDGKLEVVRQGAVKINDKEKYEI